MEAALMHHPNAHSLPPPKPKLQPSKAGHEVNPPKLANHDQLVSDRQLFLDTLTKFHDALGTKFVAPTIAGKELDLHLLYVEVTARGGLEQVIKDRKWMDITGVFNFAHTTNNASFVLRKYYISLLHRYEQVYFAAQDRLDQPSAPLPALSSAPLPAPSPAPNQINNGAADASSKEMHHYSSTKESDPVLTKKIKRNDPESCVGDPVTGRIDGKLEHGYLVTVTVGSEKLRGILYHRETGCVDGQCPDVPCMSRNIIDDNAASGIRPHWKRRKGLKKRDPAHPKPNRNCYKSQMQTMGYQNGKCCIQTPLDLEMLFDVQRSIK